MNKKEMINFVAEKTALKKNQVEAVVDAIFDTKNGAIADAIKTGGKFTLPGFGFFKRSSRPARMGRNPQTGKEISIPASNSCSFSAGKTFKESLN